MKTIVLSLIFMAIISMLVPFSVYGQIAELQTTTTTIKRVSIETEKDAPKLFVISTSDTGTSHELKLKAIKTGEQVTKVKDFKIDTRNVIQIPLDGKISVFSEGDPILSIIKVKLTDRNNVRSELPPGVVISFDGVEQGAYTLDIIAKDPKDGNNGKQLAYEGLVVIGPKEDNVVNQVIIREIREVDNDVKKDFDKSSDHKRDRDRSKDRDRDGDGRDRNKIWICLFTPNHPACKPDRNGNCPPNWSRNEDGNCFPRFKKCPDTHWRADDDETGACVPKPKPTTPVVETPTPAPSPAPSPKNPFVSEPPCEYDVMAGVTEPCDVTGTPEPSPKPKPIETPEPSPMPKPSPDVDLGPTIDFREDTPIPSPAPDDDTGDEDLTANCGGVPCTPPEKEDSTLDDEEVVEEEIIEEETVEEDTSDDSESEGDDSSSDSDDSDGGDSDSDDGGDGDGDGDGGEGSTGGE